MLIIIKISVLCNSTHTIVVVVFFFSFSFFRRLTGVNLYFDEHFLIHLKLLGATALEGPKLLNHS